MRKKTDRLKIGTAALAACLVQTLSETDPSFKARILERLERAYREIREGADGEALHELELLSWTSEMITGFSWGKGQGRPLTGG